VTPGELIELLESGEYEKSFQFGANAAELVKELLFEAKKTREIRKYLASCSMFRVEPTKYEIRRILYDEDYDLSQN